MFYRRIHLKNGWNFKRNSINCSRIVKIKKQAEESGRKCKGSSISRRNLIIFFQHCTDLFECLYRCWVNQPICLISLCLLSKYYHHASELVPKLAEIDVTVELLTEIDKLVQLIESPILSCKFALIIQVYNHKTIQSLSLF